MKRIKINQLNWDKLRWFYLMAQYSSLSHAATHLNITQSALSRSLAELERILGTKLFERRPRGMFLLREGQDLLNILSTFFQDLTQYEEHRLSQQSTLQGQLRLSISPYLPISWLIQGTSSFLGQHPDLEFSLVQHQDSKQSFVQQADCSLQQYDASQEDDMIQQSLVTLSYGLYVAQSYLDQHGPIETIEDLQAHPKVLLKTLSTPAWGWPGSIPYEGDTSKIHTFSTAQDVLWAAQQGLGIAALPRRQTAHHPDLIALPFYIKDHEVKLYYSYPISYQNFKRVTLYGDFLKNSLKEEDFTRIMLMRSSPEIRGMNGRAASLS